ELRKLAAASRRAIEIQKQRDRIRTRATIGGLTAGLLILSAVALWGNRERKNAERSAAEAKSKAAEVLLGAGSTALSDGHSFDAMHRFAETFETLPDSSTLQGVMNPSLGFLVRRVPRLESILEHPAPVVCAAFSPNGTRVVTASDDRTARVWNAADG